MATLAELIQCMHAFAETRGDCLPAGFCDGLKRELQIRFGGDKIYIPAPVTFKKRQIIDLSRQLPASVVADRLGVSHSWALRATKPKN